MSGLVEMVAWCESCGYAHRIDDPDCVDAGDEPRCVACDGPLDDNDHSDSVCDDCSGLAHCIDDLCYGQGWCMHVKDAWRP